METGQRLICVLVQRGRAGGGNVESGRRMLLMKFPVSGAQRHLLQPGREVIKPESSSDGEERKA